MRFTQIKSCFVGPAISPEQYISEHTFIYIGKGAITGFDGNAQHTLRPGEYCVMRKNCLVRYNKEKENNEFEKVVIVFDEEFLKRFLDKYKPNREVAVPSDVFVRLTENTLIPNFVHSLIPYYDGQGKIMETFVDVKREELMLILLQSQPELAGIFFDFGVPEKINLEEFMNHNYRFNVSIERFAYLTGRSLSAFKRDFRAIFNETPNRWLIYKRLQEAHFLIAKKQQKSSDIYLDLGFEDLSHFSFAFKKQFGYAPTELAR
ncbi:AraC-type DNA-binding protein [Chitinophaga sp. YR627]|uniref:helix-turn-helix domain-containing protein n=1 Tax=Chitinophaga sp. YR627 TaxID=1881041 RepID=UPI0008F440F1|nr:AraC family transcriptional regulator [Chitinophaga sp. YR627]SFM83781.1 AraC-type DNA-binding protein [Chitinophaga sp. YR627]